MQERLKALVLEQVLRPLEGALVADGHVGRTGASLHDVPFDLGEQVLRGVLSGGSGLHDATDLGLLVDGLG